MKSCIPYPKYPIICFHFSLRMARTPLFGSACPFDYYGPHRDPPHSFGGYAPNMQGLQTGLTKVPFETSTTRRDFTAPSLPISQETTSCGNVFLGRSGFSVAKALHNPSTMEVMRARNAQAQDFYSLKSRLKGDCTISDDLRTETYERFNDKSLKPETNCGKPNYYWMHAPGSRDSGFTNCYSTINPVYWTQPDPTMDQLGKNPPAIRLNAASVSQTDYQPHSLVCYESSPIIGTIQTRRTKGTGFTNSKELHPCFLPEPCIYGKHDTSFLGDPSRFDTTYGHDFQARDATCDWKGMPVQGRGQVNLKSRVEESPDFSLGCGPPRNFVSETRERFIDHWPLEGQRNFGLSFPINKVSTSGYCHSIKKHGREPRGCAPSMDALDTSPQRYNPWPRFYLGHRTMLERTYRPNPHTTGIDYTVTNSLPTTSDNASVFLY